MCRSIEYSATAVKQELIQTQEQQQVQVQQQRLKAQHVMLVRMLEMPLAQMEQHIQAELQENPGLEATPQSDAERLAEHDNASDGDDSTADETFEEKEERQERADELDLALESMDRDDRLESSNYERLHNADPDADQEERIYGQTQSFYDRLTEQIGEHDLTDRQRLIMEYLIGSLDSDGLLRKELGLIADEIAIKEYIDVSTAEIERCVDILQSFDPAGIGAQSLQECLLIQILRMKPTYMTKLMHRVVDTFYNEFTHNKWRTICSRMNITPETGHEVLAQLRRLNPRPGAAMGETMGRNTEQVTPDFIIGIDDDDNITIHLNMGNVPELHVSHDFEQMMDAYKQNGASMSRADKEALLYMQQKVQRAKNFIYAVQQRQNTLLQTMRAIVTLQRRYILSGDEWELVPMKLKDVAELAGVDISTASRVCLSKYAETPWGIVSLRSFFSNSITTEDGEEMSTIRIKNALRELIESDEGKELSDIKLAEEMKRRGYPIARRTVAKYREQMGIAASSLRKNRDQ